MKIGVLIVLIFLLLFKLVLNYYEFDSEVSKFSFLSPNQNYGLPNIALTSIPMFGRVKGKINECVMKLLLLHIKLLMSNHAHKDRNFLHNYPI